MIQSCRNAVLTPDPTVLWVTAVTAAFGVLMVYDASAVSAALRLKFDSPTFFLQRHFAWYLIGLICMFGASRVRVSRFEHLALPITLATLVMLILVLIPGIGHSAGGARRWLRLGPFSVQPGEFMRLVLAVYLARLLSVKTKLIDNFKSCFLPAILVTGATVMLLAAQPKYGTALILVLLAGALLFVAGIPYKQLLAATTLTIPFILFAIFKVGYIQDRIDAWLHPAAHSQGAGFQMMQSLIAIGSGGLWGTGLGQGRQKMFYLPEAHTDMIFPVISEELGLIGALCLVSCFGLIFFKGIQIAKSADHRFGQLLAIGLTLCICVPATLNLLVASGLFPVTGVALPLVSFGGTALVTDMTAMGLLAGIPVWSNRSREGVA